MKSNVGRCPYFSSPSFTRSWVTDLIQGTGFPGSSRSNLLEVAQTAIGGNLIGETHTVGMHVKSFLDLNHLNFVASFTIELVEMSDLSAICKLGKKPFKARKARTNFAQ